MNPKTKLVLQCVIAVLLGSFLLWSLSEAYLINHPV